jgi:glycerophosphoryl diester phosphodiesterase
VLGHRGAATAGLAENTLQSLRYAAPWSDVLEFDLRMTSDHQLVLMHDVTLDRTTNCSGPVSSWSLAALQQMCRVGDQPIPTFDEAVRYAASVGKPIAPELKPASMDRSDLQQFLATLAAHDMTARSWVQSYYGSRLEALRQLAPGLRTVLVSAGAPPVASVRAVHPDAVAASLAALTLPAVSAYHRAGVRVWGWTARDVAALETAHALDCDSVVTDIPRTARLRYR